MSRPYSKKNGFWIIAKDDSFWNDIFFAVDENWGPVYTGRLFRYRRLVAPLWHLILPLTLLSAYLILWKPRKRA